MIRDVLTNVSMTTWPMIALGLFVVSFSAAAFWAFAPKRAAELEMLKMTPLNDEQQFDSNKDRSHE